MLYCGDVGQLGHKAGMLYCVDLWQLGHTTGICCCVGLQCVIGATLLLDWYVLKYRGSFAAREACVSV